MCPISLVDCSLEFPGYIDQRRESLYDACEVNVIEKYLEMIRDATARPGVYAYRGQANSTWSLHSGATRRMIRGAGNEVQSEPKLPQMYISYHRDTLIEPARTQGFGIEDGRSISDLQLLAKLQHFGAATGLLDFTWDPLIAIWFACHNAPDTDGKMYVVNTTDTIHFSRISHAEREHDIQYMFDPPDNSPPLLYWEPMSTGDAMPRILRQRSVFVVGRPLVPDDPEIVSSVDIEKEDKDEILRDLQILDISRLSLFQDVQGFSQAEDVYSSIRQIREPKWYLIQGNRSYQNRAFSEAIRFYGECMNIVPEVSEPYFLRGNAWTGAKEYERAIQDYTSAIQLGDLTFIDFSSDRALDFELRIPFLYMVFFNRANAKVELKDFEGALVDYTESMQLNPGSSGSFFNRGNTYLDLSKFEEAVSDFDNAISLGTRSALFNKGNALVLLGRFREALECYTLFEEQAEDGADVTQNRHSLENVIETIGDSKYQLRTEIVSGDMDVSILKVLVDLGDAIGHSNSLNIFPFDGRIGNTGGFGWFDQIGGTGFKGKPGFAVWVSKYDD